MLGACGTKPITPSDKHIQLTSDTPKAIGTIPQPSKNAVVLPPPKPVKKVETYSVVVANLPAREILFQLARDAKINIDIHPGVKGEVTINAINQTLPQILDRIAKQVDIRYELNDTSLVVMPDSPYLKSYKIDYVNMSRDAEGGISNTSQVSGSTSGATGGAANNSQLAIKNSSKNHFWDTLVKNITDILRETDKILPEGSSEVVVQQSGTQNIAGNKKPPSKKGDTEGVTPSTVVEGEGTTITRRSTFREAASVIPNPEAGIITVRATARQHEKIQELISLVMRNARRQVLIEATIAEVRLNSNYQQGINWSALALGGKGFTLNQIGTGTLPSSNTGSMFTLSYNNATSRLGNLSGAVKLLDSFGDVKVLSSPKLSVLNNQTAMLRVVDNNVYFIVNSSTQSCAPAPCTPVTTYTTTMNSVQVGFTMSVTPQISDNDTVLLNVRPTITRRLEDATDPTPGIVANKIPQISTREMESVLKIENNQIVVLGGLMQDEINNQTDGVPLLDDMPLVGNAFKNRNDKKAKTELVIFLRPIVIKDASLNGDYSAYRSNLPGADFLKPENEKAQP
ncbi:MAG: pilus (MSHA type) biogenesis protein MshL [Sideroxydans sp.]